MAKVVANKKTLRIVGSVVTIVVKASTNEIKRFAGGFVIEKDGFTVAWSEDSEPVLHKGRVKAPCIQKQ